jgi:preprotein translocase subunit SecG
MITFLTIVHVLVCLFLILVVLLQAGKGGGMGIAFGGGGGSQTVFGSSGAGNFLTRLTSVTALVFLLTSLGLAHFSSQQDSRRLQRLAERKAVEKKANDARSAQVKAELDKARETAQSRPPIATTPVGGAAAVEQRAKRPADELGAAAPQPSTKTTSSATAPKRRKRPASPAAAAPSDSETSKPAEAPEPSAPAPAPSPSQ